MSQELQLFDFNREATSWTDAFGPADPEQRKKFYARVKAELARLKYLDVKFGKASNKVRPMLEVNSEFKLIKRHTELVMLDIAKVWNEFIANGNQASHSIEPADDGFRFHFALRDEDQYCIVGWIQATGVRD